MNVFFDVDDTIIHWVGDTPHLRAGVPETFAALTAEGHQIYLWSGVGIRWDIVEKFKLGQWVSDCFHKPREPLGAQPAELQISPSPDFVIDDYPEIVDSYRGTVIARFAENETGAEFTRIRELIRALAAEEDIGRRTV